MTHDGDPPAGGTGLSGRVRQELLARQLQGHLPPPPATAVDLGAGTGEQGLRLARAGFDVTLLEPSPSRLRLLRDRLGREPAGVSARVTIVEGGIDAAHHLRVAGGFGIVCCHAVLPFTDDPPGLMEAMVALAAPGAVLSVVWKNADAVAMRAALRGGFEEATRLLQGRGERGPDGRVLAAHGLGEVTAAAEDAGVTVAAWYGLQVFTAHRDESADEDRVAAALELEEKAGRRDPYRRVARQLHLVGRAP